mgnify:CR=1 FL=1
MLYLGFGQINVLIVPVYLIQKALVLQFKLVKQLVGTRSISSRCGRFWPSVNSKMYFGWPVSEPVM